MGQVPIHGRWHSPRPQTLVAYKDYTHGGYVASGIDVEMLVNAGFRARWSVWHAIRTLNSTNYEPAVGLDGPGIMKSGDR